MYVLHHVFLGGTLSSINQSSDHNAANVCVLPVSFSLFDVVFVWRSGASLKARERLTPDQKRQVREITGTSLPPPPFMDGALFPGPGAEKTGINIVRTVYDFVVEIWRRHDHDLDFRLTFEEFSAGSRLDPALACSMVDGCYEYVAQPDPNSIHWCKESLRAPATIHGCNNDICATVNDKGAGSAGQNDGDAGEGPGNKNSGGARRRKERARRRPQKNLLLSSFT